MHRPLNESDINEGKSPVVMRHGDEGQTMVSEAEVHTWLALGYERVSLPSDHHKAYVQKAMHTASEAKSEPAWAHRLVKA